MSFLWRKNPKEELKKGKAQLKRNIHDIEREIQELKREEAKLVADIRMAARAGNEPSTRVLAKQLVRLREHMVRLQTAAAGLQGVKASLSVATTSTSVAGALKTAGASMNTVSNAVDPSKLQKQMKEFARVGAEQEIRQSLINDSIDNALNTEDIEGETSDVVQQLLEEVGLEISSKLTSAPALPVRNQASQSNSEERTEDDELLRQLARLKAV